MKKKSSRSVLFLVALLLVALTSGIGGYALSELLANNVILDPHRVDYKQFESNEYIVFAQDKKLQTPLLLVLDLQRKQLSDHEYLHYYRVKSVVNGKATEANYSGNFDSATVQATDFVKSFRLIKNTDLSTRMSVSFTIESQGNIIEVMIPEFQGDFITKNYLEYTRVVSESNAMLKLNGREIEATAVGMDIYSTDYSKQVFFEGYSSLRSVTHYVVAWTDTGDFYIVDDSKVQKSNPYYTSHTWVLMKNEKNEMKKSFSAHISHEQSKLPKSWKILLPDSDEILTFSVDYYFNERASGLLKGTVTTNGQAKVIQGYAIYAEY